MKFNSWDHHLLSFFTITVIFWDLQRGTWSEGVFFTSTTFNMFWYDGLRLSSINSCVFILWGKTCQPIVHKWIRDSIIVQQIWMSIAWISDFHQFCGFVFCDYKRSRSAILKWWDHELISTWFNFNCFLELATFNMVWWCQLAWSNKPNSRRGKFMFSNNTIQNVERSSQQVSCSSVQPINFLCLLSEAQKVCFVKWKSPFLWNDRVLFQETEEAYFVIWKTSLLRNEIGLLCASEMAEASFVRWNEKALFYQMQEASCVIEKSPFWWNNKNETKRASI